MIEPSGMEQAKAELDTLLDALAHFPAIAAGDISAAFEKALMLLQSEAADYPEPPPDSTYRRTGTLGRRWTSAMREVALGQSGAFVAGRVGNITPYGIYVQDPDEQAGIHRGRWRTTQQIVADNQAGIAQILAETGRDIVTHLAQEAQA